MAATVDRKASFKAGLPQALFRTDVPALEVQYGNDYSVSGDAQRFLVNTRTARGVSA